MIRPFIFVLAICAAGTAQALPSFLCSPPASYTPHPAVVRVVAPEKDGTSYGSGALVAVTETTGLVVTNWHVVRDAAGQVFVVFPDGFRSPANVLRTDRDWDLAALAIWRPKASPMAVANAAPRPGEMLTIAGYGSGSYRAVSGQCTQYVSPGGNFPFEMIELDAPARNGDSGGPIINERGELAGVLFGSAFGKTTGSYCGRLRWFLAPAEGDFRRISTQEMLARQSRSNPAPVAALPVNAVVPASTGQVVQGSQGAQDIARLAPAGASQQISGEAQGRAYSTLPPAPSAAPVAAIQKPAGGPLPNIEHIKTVLAAIGVVAVLYSSLKLLGWVVG